MAMASDITENELKKLMVTVEEITWSRQTYTVREIFAQSSLPVIARVEDSYLADQYTDSYSTGETLWINGAIEQRRVIMESRNGEYWSVPISKNFKMRRAGHENEEYQPLSETLVQREIGEWNEISDESLYRRVNGQLCNTFSGCELKCMRIIREDCMTFLTGFCLLDEMTDCPPSVIKHHPKQTFVLAIGLKAQTFTKWSQFCRELASFLNASTTNDEPKLPGITLYSKENADRERQYMQQLRTEENKTTNEKEASYSSNDQGNVASYDTRNKLPMNLTSKTGKKETNKFKTRTLKLIRQLSTDQTCEKDKRNNQKPIPHVMKGKKNKEAKYRTLLLSTEESPGCDKSFPNVSVENCHYNNDVQNVPLEPDKPQEQYTDNIPCYSQSESISSAKDIKSGSQSLSLIRNNPYLSKSSVSVPEYYQRELPQAPQSYDDVPPSITYDEIPLSTTYEEASPSVTHDKRPPSIPEGLYEEIDRNMMQEFEKLKIKNGPIHCKDDLPHDLKMLNLDQVGDCLQLLHLERHIDAFKTNDIDGVILCELTKNMLINDLGLTGIEALKLRKFVDQKWLPCTVPVTETGSCTN